MEVDHKRLVIQDELLLTDPDLAADIEEGKIDMNWLYGVDPDDIQTWRCPVCDKYHQVIAGEVECPDCGEIMEHRHD